MAHMHFVKQLTGKYLKVVIPRSERLIAEIRIGLDRGIQKEWRLRSSRSMTFLSYLLVEATNIIWRLHGSR